MRNIIISEEEKRRILNLHEGFKKGFLSEQVSGTTSGTTSGTSSDTTRSNREPVL